MIAATLLLVLMSIKAPRKKCPYCVQMIPLDALICPICRRDVDTPESIKVILNDENERIGKARNLIFLIYGIIITPIIVFIIFMLFMFLSFGLSAP